MSSGAIAAGIGPLGLASRPTDLATQQAAASVGQGALVAAYQAAFGAHGLTVGQVLLTADDTTRRSHYTNARRTLERLLELGIVPIVNENDTVATHEIRFGDNDRLAALVADLVAAQGLVLLTDVDALYDGPPSRGGSRRVPLVATTADLEAVTIGGTGSSVGSGGMVTKVEAAGIAGAAGIPTLLTRLPDVRDALAGADVGTVFAPAAATRASRKRWLAHATTARGRLVLDDGAVAAVTERRKSLLAAGITAVRGTFAAGRPGRRVRARRDGHRPRAGVVRLGRAAPAARALDPRPGPRARQGVRARGHPPRRPRRPLTRSRRAVALRRWRRGRGQWRRSTSNCIRGWAISSWLWTSWSSRRPDSWVRCEEVEHARHRAAEGDAGVLRLEQVGGEQGGGDVAGAVGLQRQVRRAHDPGAVAVDGEHLDGALGAVRAQHARDEDRRGPMARASSTEARVESRSPGSVSVRKPSSNWFGVMRSAFGTTFSRRSTGIAGWTKQPEVALPMTGSQA